MSGYLNQKSLQNLSSKRIVALATAAALATMAVGSAPAYAFTSWEVASEFSDTSNPSDGGVGPFSYGSEPILNTALFTQITVPFTSGNTPPITGWMGTATPSDGPYVMHNMNNTTQGPFASTTYPPHALALHPSQKCEYAVARFTAPKKGKYRISGQFYAIDSAGTTTDVHISLSTAPTSPIYNGIIDVGAGMNSASFTTQTVALPANGTIDFQVGCGRNGDYFFDSTGLNAVIERK